jgi:hypothetical protein
MTDNRSNSQMGNLYREQGIESSSSAPVSPLWSSSLGLTGTARNALTTSRSERGGSTAGRYPDSVEHTLGRKRMHTLERTPGKPPTPVRAAAAQDLSESLRLPLSPASAILCKGKGGAAIGRPRRQNQKPQGFWQSYNHTSEGLWGRFLAFWRRRGGLSYVHAKWQ